MQAITLTQQEIDQVSGAAIPVELPPGGPGPYNPFPMEDAR